jgi:hypothetical protein
MSLSLVFDERQKYEIKDLRNQNMNSISSAEKLELMERLRGQQDWEQACQLRELFRLQARHNGYSREDAKEFAWQQMIELFPPQSPAEIATEPVFQWLAKGNRPHQAFTAIDPSNGSGDVSFVDMWRCSCLAIALLHARTLGYRLLKFKVFEAMVRITDADPENLELRSVLANVVEQPLAFLKRFALSRFESLLSKEDLLPEEARGELRGITVEIRQMMLERVDDVLTGTLV